MNTSDTLVNVGTSETVARKASFTSALIATGNIGAAGKGAAIVVHTALVNICADEAVSAESVLAGAGEPTVSVGTLSIGITIVHVQCTLVDVEA